MDNRDLLPHRSNTPAVPGRPLSPRASVSEANNLSPAFLLSVFRQWWKVVMPLGLLLAAGLGYAVFHFYVPMYESSALILIEDQAPYIAYETRVAGGTHMSDRYLQTQIELLRSDVVLGPVLARPEIASLKEFEQKPDRLAHIKEHLSIRQVGKSELYNVQYVSPSRDAAERIANAVVEVYLNIQSTDDSRRTNSVIKVLDEQATQRADEVRILRNKVTELAKEVTGRDPFAGGVAIELTSLHPPEAIYNNLVELEVEREMMAAELQAVKESAMATATHEDASGLIDLAVESNDEIKARQQQITELQAAMEAFQATSVRRDWQSSAEYQQMTRSLEVAKETLPKRQEEIRRELLAKRTQELNTRNEAEIARIESELRKLNAKAKLLEEKYAEHRGERKESGATSAELEFQRSELERKTGVLEMIEARRLALRTEQRAPARVRLRQPARAPLKPVEPIPYKLLAMFCSAGLLAPFGLVTIRELLARRISNSEQLHDTSRLRVLGEIARFPVRSVVANPRPLSARTRQEMVVFAESVDALRTNLMLSEVGENYRVITVASASPSEGKTSVATALAASVANATQRPTLIIDGDLRSPDVASVLGLNKQPGLGEFLSGECQLDDAIHQVGEKVTFVMPAGRIKKNPHNLVRTTHIDEMLAQLRNRFETIIIDTGPVLSASESLVFAKCSDAVLVCTLRDHSRARQVQLAVDRLEHAGCHIAGAVLSGVSVDRYTSMYGYYSDNVPIST